MNEFKTYHPLVNFTYFIFVLGFSCFLMHPMCLFISLICGFAYSMMLKAKTNLIYMVGAVLITALINSAFNHEGTTVIGYLPSGNPLTVESIVYGLCAGIMIVSVIYHFSCYNEVMTSDKFIYLFGKIIPAMSLILSITLRFVPKFLHQLKAVTNAQRCMGRDIGCPSIIKRAKHGLNILSIMTTWSLENAVETADSMKSRGYGIPGRTAFSIFTFDKRDKKAFICILFLGIYTFAGILEGEMYFSFFPSIKAMPISLFGISVFASYLLLCMYPIIIEFWEVIKWKALRSKI